VPAPDLVLFDASSYVYRAFHALPSLSTSRGEPTGALLGVLNMLQKFRKDYQPHRIGVVFDAPGKTFRDALFAEYKAHRPSMPDDLRSQIEPLLKIIAAQGLPILRIPGVEADDVIGTLACRAAGAGHSVLISTGDKDMAQLVDGSITLINTMNNTLLDREGVKAKFDVYPEQIIDYLALVGDNIDNIPGIDKVGPKTAAKLLQQYGSVDNLIGRAAEVAGKVGENLRAGLETLELSRKLATIRTDLDLPLSLEELIPTAPDGAALRELYTHYELRGLLRALDGADSAAAAAPAGAAMPAEGAAPAAARAPAPASVTGSAAGSAVPAAAIVERRYETITRWEDLERWLALLRQAPLFAFDT
jgi:DNA polymerase I